MQPVSLHFSNAVTWKIVKGCRLHTIILVVNLFVLPSLLISSISIAFYTLCILYILAFYTCLYTVNTIPAYRACGCDLKTYDQKYYQGRSLLIRQQNANFNNDYFNDRIESARVYGKCQWLLYQHSNFGGKYYILNPGYSYSKPSKWGGSGNRISSARALPPKGTKAIVLFQHNQYSGRMLVLYASNSNLPAIDFNDQLSSFIITGGRWALYEHTKYQGKSVVLGPGMYTSASTALGGAGGNDRISSIKVWKCWYQTGGFNNTDHGV